MSQLPLRLSQDYGFWTENFAEVTVQDFTLSHHIFPATHITNLTLTSFSALLPRIICKTSVIYLTYPVRFLYNQFSAGILSVFYLSAFFSAAADSIISTNTVTGHIHSVL